MRSLIYKNPPAGESYLISACLVGVRSRYDGSHALNALALELLEAGKAYPLCPEQLGGLPTPREPAEIDEGDGTQVLEGLVRVIDKSGGDRTAAFLRGAEEVGILASRLNPAGAILMDGSPSCGVTYIHRKGGRVKGLGVTAARLHKQGIPLYIIKEGGLECILPGK